MFFNVFPKFLCTKLVIFSRAIIIIIFSPIRKKKLECDNFSSRENNEMLKKKFTHTLSFLDIYTWKKSTSKKFVIVLLCKYLNMLFLVTEKNLPKKYAKKIYSKKTNKRKNVDVILSNKTHTHIELRKKSKPIFPFHEFFFVFLCLLCNVLWSSFKKTHKICQSNLCKKRWYSFFSSLSLLLLSSPWNSLCSRTVRSFSLSSHIFISTVLLTAICFV